MTSLDTALYYALSTISQTLAGAMGLFAAFIIIRIGSFNQVLYEHMSQLYSELSMGDDTLRKARARCDATAVFAFYRQHLENARPTMGFGHPPRMPLDPSQELRLGEGEAMVSRKARLLLRVARVLWPSAATIVLCFLGLASTPYLAGHTGLAAGLLSTAVLFGAGCVIALVVVMVGALRES